MAAEAASELNPAGAPSVSQLRLELVGVFKDGALQATYLAAIQQDVPQSIFIPSTAQKQNHQAFKHLKSCILPVVVLHVYGIRTQFV